MNVTLAYPDLQQLIMLACKIMESSDLGRDATNGDAGPAFILRAKDNTLSLAIAVRGMELKTQVDLNTCEEPGEIAINPFLLKRMSVKASEASLTTDEEGKTLQIKAGRFKSNVAAVQMPKPATYEEVPLTHRIPSKTLVGALATTLLEQQTGQPRTRLIWDARGLRLWSHNAYNATYSMVLDETPEAPLDCILPVALVKAVADSSKHDLQIGVDRQTVRLKNDVIDITHPLEVDLVIEDIESALDGMTPDSLPHFEINPMSLVEALQAVGSVDLSVGVQKIGVDLWTVRSKNRLICSVQNTVGESTHRVDLGTNTLTEDFQVKVNHKQLIDFAFRVKGQNLKIGVLPDRTLLWANTTTFVLAPVQEDQNV